MINAAELKRRKENHKKNFGKHKLYTVVLYLATVFGFIFSVWALFSAIIIIGG